MPSTILSDNGVTSGTSGIKTTGSNDGTLALQTTTAGGAATTALTINTTQAIGVGSSPSFGTNGQLLTSSGSGAAPTWTTVSAPAAATPTVLGTVFGSTLSTGTYEVALGSQALGGGSNTGLEHTAIGRQVLLSNTSGASNTGVGYAVLYPNTTGSYNVSSGAYSMRNNTTGSENVASGYSALNQNTTGANNTAIGTNALYANTTASNNTAVGHAAGSTITEGTFNVCIGRSAGNYGASLTTGAQNTYIGPYAGPSASSVNHELCITTSNSQGKGGTTGFINPNGGGIYQGNNSSSWSTTSDQRLKKNIVDNTEGLDKVVQIRVRNFEYRTEKEIIELEELPVHTVVKKEGVQLGVIAQELQEICPDCVKTETTGVISVDSDNIFWHMVNAIKDLKALNDTQAATITALTARIVALENRV